VFGVLPNFYVSYIPNAAPLTGEAKVQASRKNGSRSFTLVFVGGAAGVEQAAQNHFAEYGPGAQGYGKRFGATMPTRLQARSSEALCCPRS